MGRRTALIINGEVFEVDATEITGAQIRAIAGLDPVIDLVVQATADEDEDRALTNSDKVNLTKATVHVFTRPQTSFGSGRS